MEIGRGSWRVVAVAEKREAPSCKPRCWRVVRATDDGAFLNLQRCATANLKSCSAKNSSSPRTRITLLKRDSFFEELNMDNPLSSIAPISYSFCSSPFDTTFHVCDTGALSWDMSSATSKRAWSWSQYFTANTRRREHPGGNSQDFSKMESGELLTIWLQTSSINGFTLFRNRDRALAGIKAEYQKWITTSTLSEDSPASAVVSVVRAKSSKMILRATTSTSLSLMVTVICCDMIFGRFVTISTICRISPEAAVL